MKSRYFFFGMALLFIAIGLLGFVPSFQSMQARTLKVHWLTHIHSVLMSSWLLLFCIQAGLVANGNLALHRRLGLLSFGIGILVISAMITVAVHFLIANQPPEGSFLFDLLVTEFFETIGFALFFLWGMSARKKDAAVHKRLLLFATIFLLIAAIDRISWLPQFGLEHRSVDFIYQDLLFLPLFAYDLFQYKRVYKVTAIAALIMVMMQSASLFLYESPSWHHFWFKATAPLMEKLTEVQLSRAQAEPLLGDYDGYPYGRITISQDKGQLYLQIGGGDKMLLGARSETELFWKTEVMHFLFVKAADGKVSNATAEQVGRIYPLHRIR
jgi:hypothetical protein